VTHFDALAPDYDRLRPAGEGWQEVAGRALAALGGATRLLDVGCGTGRFAVLAAERLGARVWGVDASAEMLREAKARLPEELRGRVRFRPADASALPYPDGEFQLVTLMNMIPFFDELARVTAPGGAVVVSFSRGAETPIYVPQERLRRRLARRGFTQFADFSAAPATALRAVRGRVPGNGSSRHGRTGPDA